MHYLNSDNPSLSIIIPALNEARFIGRVLDALAAQTYKDFEVIVVDGGSKDNTVDIASSYAYRLPALRIITELKRGVSRARNRGAEEARAPYLLFLDADVYLDPDFLERNFKEFVARDVAAATPYIKVLSVKRKDKLFEGIFNAVYLLFARTKATMAGGYCIFSKKSVHDKIGGFDETILIAEDHDYVRRAKKYGGFALLHGPRIHMSVRRWDEEGRARIMGTYVAVGFYNILKGNVRSDVFRYHFGRYSDSAAESSELFVNIYRPVSDVFGELAKELEIDVASDL